MPLHEPQVGSQASGSAWDWADESEMEGRPPLFETIIWNGYSSGDGEFAAVTAKWSLDIVNKLLHLEHVSYRSPYQPWSDFLTQQSDMLSVRHLQLARGVAAEYFEMKRFRLRTRLYPQES